jgi:prefoldin subunit 2
MSDSEKPLDENQVIAKYKELQSTCQSFATKMSELEQELSEHRYVVIRLILTFAQSHESANWYYCAFNIDYLSLHIRLVEETLIPLDVKRRAFRLVGGVLVERTVGEVLPSVVTNRENVSNQFDL